MTRIEQLEQKVKRLEQKICCKTQFFDTVEDLPTEGSTGVIYVTEDGNIYVWNGSNYISTTTTNDINYGVIAESMGSSVKVSSYPMYSTPTSYTLTDGIITGSDIYVTKTIDITKVIFNQITQGNYTADEYNGIGLYSYNNLNGDLTLIGSTPNDGDIWKSTALSYPEVLFGTTITLTPGIYFVLGLLNTSASITAPTIRASTHTSNPYFTFNFPNSGKLSFISSASHTVLPAVLNMSGTTATTTKTTWHLG